MKIAYDHALVSKRYGIHVMAALGQEMRTPYVIDHDAAYDAQPQLQTAANSGVPALFTTVIDPKIIQVLVTPTKAAELYGETKKGTWVSDTAMFVTAERAGYVSAYGDFSMAGRVSANVNYPQRQAFHYQTFVEYGERETEREAEGKIDWVNMLNMSAALVLLKFQNASYLFGVAGLQNYGGINDPLLPAAIAPTTTWSQATPDVIYGDLLRLVQKLVAQSGGILDAESTFTLGISPNNALNLNKTNTYNVNVFDQIKKNFPNLTIVTIPEFSNPTGGGELLQLIAKNVDGQPTVESGFTEKMRSHAVVTKASSWEQKKSQGTWGTIWYRPVFCASMIG